jgi:hypothetical protein
LSVPAPRPLEAQALAAVRSIDLEGLRSLEEVSELSFDAGVDGTAWVYRFGRRKGREESQIFRVDTLAGRYELFPLPELVQRLRFRLLRVDGRLLYLVGGTAADTRDPAGFALDHGGRIVWTLHRVPQPLDAVARGGRVWIAYGVPQPQGPSALALTRLAPDEPVGSARIVPGWQAADFCSLALADERLVLGGVGAAGRTRIELLDEGGGVHVKCPDVGRPRGLGAGGRDRLYCLGSAALLASVALPRPRRMASSLPASAGALLRLTEEDGSALDEPAALRVIYRRLFVLSGTWDRILEFAL